MNNNTSRSSGSTYSQPPPGNEYTASSTSVNPADYSHSNPAATNGSGPTGLPTNDYTSQQATLSSPRTAWHDQPDSARSFVTHDLRTGTGAYSTSATPNSEYAAFPSPARAASFPEALAHRQAVGYPTHHAADHAHAHAHAHAHGHAVTLPGPSPPYAATYATHSPYTPMTGADMGHSAYVQNWPAAYTHGLNAHAIYSQAARGQPLYNFISIPGAQQQKRPRRRYEEIERIYKCGWESCEKAYGTLNHLNAHVTMQSHGPKRTPDEFKEVRRAWKEKKKKEEDKKKKEAEENKRVQQQHSPAVTQGMDMSTAALLPYVTKR